MARVERRPRRTAKAAAGRASRRAASPPAARPEHFSEVFENASDIVIVNDAEGRIIAANRAARDSGGYSAEDIARGVTLADIMPPDERDAALALTRHALGGGDVPQVYHREAELNGARRVFELRSNVLTRDGKAYALQTIARDVTEQQEAVAFQSSLLQVSQALLTARTLDELGAVICEAAGRVLAVDGAYLWLRRGDELVGIAAAGRGAEGFVGARRPIESSVVGAIYRASDVLIVNDFARSLYARGELRDEIDIAGVQALLAVPLRRTLGVGVLVFTDSTNPRRFSAMLRDRAAIFGAQMTVAIEAALARERSEDEGRVSSALLRVARAIGGSLDEGDVLREIVSTSHQVLGCDAVAVALWDGDKQSFRVAATSGLTAEADEELRVVEFRPTAFPRLDGLLKHQTLEFQAPTMAHPELATRWGIESLLLVPIARGSELIGTLGVISGQRQASFWARQRRIAEGIAMQAGSAVHNARLVEALRRANELKSEFLGTMSHELRTPLNAILGYAELMRDEVMGPLLPEQGATLDRMLVNGRALLELINMTLDVNRLEAGRMTLQPSEFTLDELIAELRQEFDMRAERGMLLLVWPQAGAVPPLSTDRGKLKTVLRNLVQNALKFTPAGSVIVDAAYDQHHDRLRLSVADTGIGIPPDAVDTIFDMFSQLHAHVTPSGGVGLGLYLVRRYAELLGGTVAVDSHPGQGSTFTVDIPRQLHEAAGSAA